MNLGEFVECGDLTTSTLSVGDLPMKSKVYFDALATPQTNVTGQPNTTITAWEEASVVVSAPGIFTDGGDVFTAPRAGVYSVFAHVTVDCGTNHTRANLSIHHMRAGTEVAILASLQHGEGNLQNTKQRNLSATAIVQLQAGDVIQMRVGGENAIAFSQSGRTTRLSIMNVD